MPDPSLPPPIPASALQPSKPKTSRLTIALGVIVLGLAGYYFGIQVPSEKAALRKAEEEKKLAVQREEAEKIRPHTVVKALIKELREKGQTLPDCPLIFPLLNEKKKLTPIGSYLSYLGMKKAVYMPQAIYRFPNAGEVFQTFDLFNPHPSNVSKIYHQELPFRFMAKDFAEGTYKKTAKGYRIDLRFFGTRKTKKFSKTFPFKQIHLAPSWIAACLHQWTGFEPDAAQAAHRAQPTFGNAEDFKKGAYTEKLFRQNPGLVCGWDKVQANNPESSLLLDRWLAVQVARENRSHIEMLEAPFRKSPEDFFYRADYENLLIRDERYEEALKLIFQDLSRDENNSMWYSLALSALQNWGFYEEAVELIQTWCDKHPENQEAWMALADLYEDYAWEARGTGFADTVTEEGWHLMRQRMDRADKAAQRAAQLAPRDCRVWHTLIAMGVGVPYGKRRVKVYFDKAVALNPYRQGVYTSYLNYLAPKWFGEEGDDIAVVRKYKKYNPFIVYQPAAETFYDNSETKTVEQRRAHMKAVSENVRTSPYLADFREGMERHFMDDPLDTTYFGYYCYWMCTIGKRDECLALAKKITARKDPETEALYPTLVLLVLDEDFAVKAFTHEEANAINNRPENFKLREDAMRALVKADPNHWTAWNQLASFYLQHNRLAEAKECFEAIGDHRIEFIWNQIEFNKGKRKALGLPPPTFVPIKR